MLCAGKGNSSHVIVHTGHNGRDIIGDASIAMARMRCPAREACGLRRIEDKDKIKMGSFFIYPNSKLTEGLEFWELVKNLPGFAKYDMGPQGILIMRLDSHDSNVRISPSLFHHGVSLIDLARNNREANFGTPDVCDEVEMYGASTIAKSTNGGEKIGASLEMSSKKNKHIVRHADTFVSIADDSIKNGCINQYPGMSDPNNYLLQSQGIASLKKKLQGRFIQISFSYNFKNKNQKGRGKSTESLCWVTGMIKSVIQVPAGTAKSVRLKLQYLPLFKHEKQTEGEKVISACDFSIDEVSSEQGQWRLLSKQVNNTQVAKPKLKKKAKQSKPSMKAEVLITGIKLRCVAARKRNSRKSSKTHDKPAHERNSRKSSKTDDKPYIWPDLSWLDAACL